MLLDSLWVNTGLIRKFECEILMIFKKPMKTQKPLGFFSMGFLKNPGWIFWGGFFVCPPWICSTVGGSSMVNFFKEKIINTTNFKSICRGKKTLQQQNCEISPNKCKINSLKWNSHCFECYSDLDSTKDWDKGWKKFKVARCNNILIKSKRRLLMLYVYFFT